MSVFERPLAWLVALPWAFFCVWLAWTQATAWSEARRLVSPRFLARVTRYGRLSLTLHGLGLFVLGLVLLLAVAEPVTRVPPGPAAGEVRVLLLVDASASMYATDVAPLTPVAGADADAEISRFEVARSVARELVSTLEEARFGLVSFSGTTTLHLPITADRELVRGAVASLEPHTYYQNTGSSLTGALEAVFHFAGEPGDRAPGLQVVLLGDGELPFEESYAEPLAALAELGVPVHAVAIGSVEGQSRVIYDFRDVVAGKEEKRRLVEYETRRVDRHYQEVAAATRGRFATAGPRTASLLAGDIRASAEVTGPREGAASRWGWLPVVALAGCLGHLLFLTPPRRRRGHGFDLERLGAPRPSAGAGSAARSVAFLAVLPLLLWGCVGDVQRRAHGANERALALDDLGQEEAARAQFELSASFGFRPEIPIHNLARSLARRRGFTEAHRLFQRALELEPGLTDAHFNDGVTLYEWGKAERDPRNCQLERTLELWRVARGRFASIAEGVVERDEPAARSALNLERLDEEIAAVERLIAEPPDSCRTASESPAGGGAARGDGGSGEAGGEGGDDGEDTPPAGGVSGEPPAPPEPAASGSLSAEERQRIATELERIAAQAAADGKYYRRTRSEQFRREDWSDPEAVIWW